MSGSNQSALRTAALKLSRFNNSGVPQSCATHFQAAQEGLGVLAVKRFTIALTRIAQYQAQDPTAACFTLALIDRSSQAEVQLQLFSRLTFQAPNPLRMTGSLLADKALDRSIGIREAIFLDQILVNTPC